MRIELDYRGLYVEADVDLPTGPCHLNGMGPDIGSLSVRSAVIADVEEFESWYDDYVGAAEGQEFDASVVEDDEDFVREAWSAAEEYA